MQYFKLSIPDGAAVCYSSKFRHACSSVIIDRSSLRRWLPPFECHLAGRTLLKLFQFYSQPVNDQTSLNAAASLTPSSFESTWSGYSSLLVHSLLRLGIYTLAQKCMEMAYAYPHSPLMLALDRRILDIPLEENLSDLVAWAKPTFPVILESISKAWAQLHTCLYDIHTYFSETIAAEPTTNATSNALTAPTLTTVHTKSRLLAFNSDFRCKNVASYDFPTTSAGSFLGSAAPVKSNGFSLTKLNIGRGVTSPLIWVGLFLHGKEAARLLKSNLILSVLSLCQQHIHAAACRCPSLFFLPILVLSSEVISLLIWRQPSPRRDSRNAAMHCILPWMSASEAFLP
jgi:hypothetical protein